MKVILVAAISLDGFITRHNEPGSRFTSEADRRYLLRILPEFDCCVFGSETYRVSKNWMRTQLMPDKLRVALTRTPEKYAGDAVPGSFEFTSAAPRDLVDNLHSRQYHTCALLGGGKIYSLFLRADCVDELWITLEARLFGNGTPFSPGEFDLEMELLSHEPLGDNALLLKYRPRSTRNGG